MKFLFALPLTAAFAFSSIAIAEPISLSDRQMDNVTAGDLTTPSGQKIFDGFANQGTGDAHPGLPTTFGGARAQAAEDATTGNGPSLSGLGNEGPWSAHIVSGGVVTCADC